MISSALNAPQSSAATSGSTSDATGSGAWARTIRTPATAPAIATTAPTEMSMPPVAITRVIPMATIITGAAFLTTSIRLPKRWPSLTSTWKKPGVKKQVEEQDHRQRDERPDQRARTSTRSGERSRAPSSAGPLLGDGVHDGLLVDPLRVQLADLDAVAQHGDAVAQRSTSSSSEEMNSTAMPLRGQGDDQLLDLGLGARRRCRGWARRGSAAAGWAASQRASITFCWLPPERFLIGLLGVGGLDVEQLDVLVRQLLLAGPRQVPEPAPASPAAPGRCSRGPRGPR